jgi:hypothetical protein
LLEDTCDLQDSVVVTIASPRMVAGVDVPGRSEGGMFLVNEQTWTSVFEDDTQPLGVNPCHLGIPSMVYGPMASYLDPLIYLPFSRRNIVCVHINTENE